MQFRVPQFIDVEDKVVGPLTLRQFGYILGAGGFSFIIWTFIPVKFVAVLLIVPIASLFLSLAFVKINNRPFGDILESAFGYYTGSKIYTWKQPKDEPLAKTTVEKAVVDAAKEVSVLKANKDRLHEVALGLDVLDRVPEQPENTK
ncbi:MAG: hypothetical protein RIQ41_272 [Candidatus Parcubacteria bacterium]|jgi:hypothetical protein